MRPDPAPLTVSPVSGIGEIREGDDLADLLLTHLDGPLRTGDVVVVTSKVVSKAAGLVVDGPRAELLSDQTDRVVARRGPTWIVRTPHGLTMAAGGVDASNTAEGTAVPLPPDPDDDARRLRAQIFELSAADVAVVISDTAGRPWRSGQTDIAVGVAGLVPEMSMTGARDPYGNTLEVTAPALADEVAAAADLVKSKLSGCPIAVVRGLRPGWATVDDGPGAASLVRPESSDLFGLGAVEAVRVAVRRDEPVRGFPAAEPGAIETLLDDAMHGIDETAVTVDAHDPERLEVLVDEDAAPSAWTTAGVLAERLRVLSVALGVEPVIAVRARDL